LGFADPSPLEILPLAVRSPPHLATADASVTARTANLCSLFVLVKLVPRRYSRRVRRIGRREPQEPAMTPDFGLQTEPPPPDVRTGVGFVGNESRLTSIYRLIS
jgi:hypothetical protein